MEHTLIALELNIKKKSKEEIKKKSKYLQATKLWQQIFIEYKDAIQQYLMLFLLDSLRLCRKVKNFYVIDIYDFP